MLTARPCEVEASVDSLRNSNGNALVLVLFGTGPRLVSMCAHRRQREGDSTMNVLLIHQAFAAPTEPGGSRHFELGRHLARGATGSIIVASDVSYLTGQQVTAAEHSVQPIGGVRVHRAYAYPSLHRSFVWRVVSFLSFMCSSIWTALRRGLRSGDGDYAADLSGGVRVGGRGATAQALPARSARSLARVRHRVGVLKNPWLIGCPGGWSVSSTACDSYPGQLARIS